MNWIYYIHHEWPEGERMRWAELFILPDDPSYDGQALWVTIDCVGETPSDNSDTDLVEWYQKAQEKLGDSAFRLIDESDDMGDTNMVVATSDFSKDEFLNWVKTWTKATGLPIANLTPAPLDEFTGRHEHADFLRTLQKMYGSSAEK